MTKKTQLDLFEIDFDQPTETLARWWNTWNFWNWPEDLLHLKPPEWEEMPHRDRESDFDKYTFVWSAMCFIQDKIGWKECMRYHHIHNLNKTNTEFEKWCVERGVLK